MSSVTIVYGLAAIISVAFALMLARLAQLSSQVKIGSIKKGAPKEYPVYSSSLSKAIASEVNKVVDASQAREISARLANLLNKELEKLTELKDKELSQKLEAIIDEKTKSEDVAWRKYNKVLSDKKKTEAVIRSIAEGLVVVDPQGKVIMMNPAAERLLGVSKKNKIGKPIAEDIRQEQLLSLVKGSGEKEDTEIELISQQDTKKTLRASSAVVENEYGQTVGMVSVLSDITKQKEVDQLKANFVANVSHELRTPLVAIDKAISLLFTKTAGEISPTQEEFLSMAQRNLKRLTLLVNDLLDLSKLEAKKMDIKLEPISIESLVREAVEGMNAWAKTKSLNIEIKIQEGLPQVNLDPNRIIQVLNNIIGNAIKFTPDKGNITIEANLHKEGNKIELSVADNGIGIAKEDLPKIFDKFYQTGERVATDINGTGIGLTIVKEIVELHGGKIWAESEKGSGAKFIFTLPLN
jgi:PAS domain S-box-containing protein